MDPPYLFDNSGGGAFRAARGASDQIVAEGLDQGFDHAVINPLLCGAAVVFCHNDQLAELLPFLAGSFHRTCLNVWIKPNPSPHRNKHYLADTEPYVHAWNRGYLEKMLGHSIQRVRADFTAQFEERQRDIERHWSKEKRIHTHSAECKARREGLKVREWRALCTCPERVLPPIDPEIIEQAKALLVPTGEPFLDLCILKGRFPSRMAQFCTEFLKLEPINAITHPILESGGRIVSWIGERADESVKRAAKPAMERIRWDGGGQLILYRPIHQWKAEDCFAIAKRHGIAPNQRASIERAVIWSRTSRGGRQFNLFQEIARREAEDVGLMCKSAYGLCE